MISAHSECLRVMPEATMDAPEISYELADSQHRDKDPRVVPHQTFGQVDMIQPGKRQRATIFEKNNHITKSCLRQRMA